HATGFPRVRGGDLVHLLAKPGVAHRDIAVVRVVAAVRSDPGEARGLAPKIARQLAYRYHVRWARAPVKGKGIVTWVVRQRAVQAPPVCHAIHVGAPADPRPGQLAADVLSREGAVAVVIYAPCRA